MTDEDRAKECTRLMRRHGHVARRVARSLPRAEWSTKVIAIEDRGCRVVDLAELVALPGSEPLQRPIAEDEIRLLFRFKGQLQVLPMKVEISHG